MAASKNDKLSASLEDYLEAIYNLAAEFNVVRSKNIAELLGVSKSSVTGAMRVLKKRGLANYKPYDCITLTESGQAAAVEPVSSKDRSGFSRLYVSEGDVVVNI